MEIRVTYDRRVNAASICLTEIGPGEVARAVEAIPSTVVLHFDHRDRLVEIEVLNARRMLPRALLEGAERIDR